MLELGGWLSELLFHQMPRPPAQVAFPYEDAAPTQSSEQAFGARIVGPELSQVSSGLECAVLEGREQTVGVTAVAFLGKYNDINQMGNASAEPEAESANPV